MALFGRKKDPATPEQATEVAAPEAPTTVPVTRRSLDEQRAHVLERLAPMRPFGMQIWDVPGLVLCEDITSDLDLPLVTTARVAGWGVRGSDLVGATPARPRSLYVVDSIAAGDAPGAPLVAGAAVEVAEGAIVPEGVDAVVAVDDGQVQGQNVVFEAEVRLYENLRRAGSELADGTPLLQAGEVLTPRSVAVLAEVGIDKVLVRPRPRVVVLTVGDTLVAPGQPLTAPLQRYDSTTALLAGAAQADGATVYPLGIVAESADAIRHALADQQIRADLVVVVGGGDAVREVVAGLGTYDEADVAINGVARYGFGTLGESEVPVIVLPGGVVSAYVGYQALVRPAINRLNDIEPLTATWLEGMVLDDLPATEGVTEYIPAFCDERGRVRPVAGVDSELAFDLARANVLLIVPESRGEIATGSRVQCLVLDDAFAPTGP